MIFSGSAVAEMMPLFSCSNIFAPAQIEKIPKPTFDYAGGYAIYEGLNVDFKKLKEMMKLETDSAEIRSLLSELLSRTQDYLLKYKIETKISHDTEKKYSTLGWDFLTFKPMNPSPSHWNSIAFDIERQNRTLLVFNPAKHYAETTYGSYSLANNTISVGFETLSLPSSLNDVVLHELGHYGQDPDVRKKIGGLLNTFIRHSEAKSEYPNSFSLNESRSHTLEILNFLYNQRTHFEIIRSTDKEKNEPPRYLRILIEDTIKRVGSFFRRTLEAIIKENAVIAIDKKTFRHVKDQDTFAVDVEVDFIEGFTIFFNSDKISFFDTENMGLSLPYLAEHTEVFENISKSYKSTDNSQLSEEQKEKLMQILESSLSRINVLREYAAHALAKCKKAELVYKSGNLDEMISATREIADLLVKLRNDEGRDTILLKAQP